MRKCVHLVVKATTGALIVGDERNMWLTRTVRRTLDKGRWNRDRLRMITGVLWRVNDEPPKVEGESLKGDVVVGKDYRENLEREEHVLVPKRVCVHHGRVRHARLVRLHGGQETRCCEAALGSRATHGTCPHCQSPFAPCPNRRTYRRLPQDLR